MRILVVENYDSCPVGVVGEQLEAMGAELTIINALQRHQPIPDNAVQGYHGLVVLGGAMGPMTMRIFRRSLPCSSS